MTDSFWDPGPFAGSGIGCERGDRPVFAGIDLHLVAGDALVLTGRNGSGKSSLLRVLAGLLAPAAGTLRWGEMPVPADLEAHRARVHYVGHQEALKPVLTVAENLRFWSRLRGGGDAAAASALARFALDALADTPGRLLSAGQRRRLSLARLMAVPAPLWLLDEPGTGLDADSLAALTEAMADHRAIGGRVVVATHQPLDVPGAVRLAVDDYPPAPLDPEAIW